MAGHFSSDSNLAQDIKGLVTEQFLGAWNSIVWGLRSATTVGGTWDTVYGPALFSVSQLNMVGSSTTIYSSHSYTWHSYGGNLDINVVEDSTHKAKNLGLYGQSVVEIDGLTSVAVQSGSLISLGIGGAMCLSTLSLKPTGVLVSAGGVVPTASSEIFADGIRLWTNAVPLELQTVASSIDLKAATQSFKLSSAGLQINATTSQINGLNIRLGEPPVPAYVEPAPPVEQPESLFNQLIGYLGFELP